MPTLCWGGEGEWRLFNASCVSARAHLPWASRFVKPPPSASVAKIDERIGAAAAADVISVEIAKQLTMNRRNSDGGGGGGSRDSDS